MLLSQNQSINVVYPNRNYLFLFTCHEKKLDSFHKQSSSRLFPTKRRVEMFFSQNQSINVVYPNGNYPFLIARREKKLDSYHE